MLALVLVWRIRGKINRTALCCVVLYAHTHTHTHTHAVPVLTFFACQLGSDFYLCVYLVFVLYVFFHVSLGHFLLVLLVLAFVVLDLVSSVLSQEICWEERL